MSSPSPVLRHCQVAVVGGSIAGCAAAAELSRVGCEVSVFERSAVALHDRGAGISAPPSHLHLLRSRGLVDGHMPTIDRSRAERVFTVHDSTAEGRVLAAQRISTYGMRWMQLYGNLRARVPAGAFRPGASAVRVERADSSRPVVILSGGSSHEVDLVLFADGYGSLGRCLLDQQATPSQAGYLAWRGLVDGRRVSSDRPATEMAMHEKGHCVIYAVPHPVDPLPAHLWNVVWYIELSPDLRQFVLLDRHGRQREFSVPRGSIRPAAKAMMQDRARALLRPQAAEVVAAVDSPLVQVVVDVRADRRVGGRLALIGDAACVARPHAGAGALKATQEAIALGRWVSASEDIDTALAGWAREVADRSDEAYLLGRSVGDALVTNSPDWTSMDTDDVLAYWNAATLGRNAHYLDSPKRSGAGGDVGDRTSYGP